MQIGEKRKILGLRGFLHAVGTLWAVLSSLPSFSGAGA